MVDLTVVIITYNEEVNIRYSLDNVLGWAKNVVVLDSYSNDKTCDIAEEMGAKVIKREFDTFAKQRNYAIQHELITTEWMLFLDADEYFLDSLKDEIERAISDECKYNGFYLKRRFYFLGHWIKYGGYYPTWILRLFKKSKSVCMRDMNEHIKTTGNIGYLKNDFVDDNKKGISEWIDKHNRYSTYEAIELLKSTTVNDDEMANLFGSQVERKRWIRQNIWNKLLPPLFRPFIYFFYRYIIRLGFLDGKEGFVYHLLQALFYRFLIDVKYIEMNKNKNKK